MSSLLATTIASLVLARRDACSPIVRPKARARLPCCVRPLVMKLQQHRMFDRGYTTPSPRPTNSGSCVVSVGWPILYSTNVMGYQRGRRGDIDRWAWPERWDRTTGPCGNEPLFMHPDAIRHEK
jgi:hypothetical protein